MEVLGIIFLVLLVIAAVAVIGFTIASASDIRRYLHIRHM